MRHIKTLICLDEAGNEHRVEVRAEIRDASHMQGSDSTIYGMHEYRHSDGWGVIPLGEGKYRCDTLGIELYEQTIVPE